jgi:hypothetical protein
MNEHDTVRNFQTFKLSIQAEYASSFMSLRAARSDFGRPAFCLFTTMRRIDSTCRPKETSVSFTVRDVQEPKVSL